jgi:hypothetical protein
VGKFTHGIESIHPETAAEAASFRVCTTPRKALKLHVETGEVKLCSEGESEDGRGENRVLLTGVREGARSCYD